ncbi:nicotinamide riboside transporter PnuC [Streptacidiphilus pinicola]|uniref:Nicotinamide riboside transporter PnuC n=1 Tax=Streptacidiphilus pinicola TaxID=2219663 RepID=A0A2X0IAX4_9ACTN|nr:nicotinamide mononucleotide transporter family protein [Streptacidiphilus pinicola]RAG82112.1 nicotinamide riboside transporter PnuC [Streptacidiphilus pinicola]
MSSLVNDLNSTAFSLFGQQIKWSDMVGNLLGLGALALGWRRSMLTWPVQLLSGVVLFAAFAAGHLSGSAGKQLIVIAVSVWGWYQWQRGRAKAGDVTVRFATWTERGVLVAATAGLTVALAELFQAYPWMSWSPWADAYIFTGTLAAMYAQARGWVEFWFAWLAVDLVGVPLNFTNGYAFSGYVYSIYFVLVILGLRSWWLRSRMAEQAEQSEQPALAEGAVA